MIANFQMEFDEGYLSLKRPPYPAHCRPHPHFRIRLPSWTISILRSPTNVYRIESRAYPTFQTIVSPPRAPQPLDLPLQGVHTASNCTPTKCLVARTNPHPLSSVFTHVTGL